jgi:cell division protein FtsI/penicillin-binding protein 2
VQLAVLVSATLNGGVILKPQVSGPEDFVPSERWRLPDTTRFDGLAAGFAGVVNEGSASAAFDSDVAVAGKTGTCAQLGWFASYAPAESPEIVLVVFLRHGSGHGASAVAGRIFRLLFGGGTGATAAGMP